LNWLELWGRKTEERTKTLIIVGVFVIAIASILSLKSGLYFGGEDSAGSVVIAGIIVVVGALLLERFKRNRNDDQ